MARLCWLPSCEYHHGVWPRCIKRIFSLRGPNVYLAHNNLNFLAILFPKKVLLLNNPKCKPCSIGIALASDVLFMASWVWQASIGVFSKVMLWLNLLLQTYSRRVIFYGPRLPKELLILSRKLWFVLLFWHYQASPSHSLLKLMHPTLPLELFWCNRTITLSTSVNTYILD